MDPDYTGNVSVVIQNFGIHPQSFKRGDKIAQLIVEHASMPKIEVVDKLAVTQRNASGFGSTEKAKNPTPAPILISAPSVDPSPHIAAAAATMETTNDDIIRGHMLS